MPTVYELQCLGGREKDVFLFDTDQTFDIQKFRRLMLSRITSAIKPVGIPLDHSEAILNQSLSRLHVLHPNSSAQLAACLVHIAPQLSHTDLGIIAIDSLSAFYWADRFALEQLRLSLKGPLHPSVYPLHNISTALESLRLSHRPLILMTNWGLDVLPSSPQVTSPRLYKQHLHPFPTFLLDPSADTNTSALSPLKLSAHITLFPVLRDVNELAIPPSSQETECLVQRSDGRSERFKLRLGHGNVEVTSCIQ